MSSKRRKRERRMFVAQASVAAGSGQPTEAEPIEPTPTHVETRRVVAEPVPGAPYKINIVQPDKASPGLEMTWCLSPEFLHELADKKICNPFLFIIVNKIDGNSHRQVARQLVPLKQGGTRLEFYSSGLFTVYTIIVKANDNADRSSYVASSVLSNLLESQRISSVGRPRTEDLVTVKVNYDCEFIASAITQDYDERPVCIEQEFFAPDPPAWLAWWVNLWFESKQKNECHFRRRMMTAFTIQPPMILLWILLRGVCGAIFALTLALIGWRWISLKPIFRPFALGLKDINSNWSERSLGMAEGYWTIGRGTGDQFEKYPVFLRILLTPLLWVFVGLIAYFLVYRFPEVGIDIAKTFGYFVFAVVVCCLVYIICILVGQARAGKADERYRQKEEKDRQKAVHKVALELIKEQRSREKIKRDFVELTCGAGGPSDGHLSSIPSRHQTFYTRFLALKGRVCRPYARGYNN